MESRSASAACRPWPGWASRSRPARSPAWSGRTAPARRRCPGPAPVGHLEPLEVARALAVEPLRVLLDEPLAGLNLSEAAQQVDVIAGINAQGITTVLVEHNLAEVMRVCRRLLVLNQGQIIADGT